MTEIRLTTYCRQSELLEDTKTEYFVNFFGLSIQLYPNTKLLDISLKVVATAQSNCQLEDIISSLREIMTPHDKYSPRI